VRITLVVALLLVLGSVAVAACTGVVIVRDGHVMVGGNEDWFRPDAYLWAEPAAGRLHGVVYFGYEVRGEFGNEEPFWYEFQGINSAGLYFDSFSAPCSELSDEEQLKPRFFGRIEQLIMRWCSTVEEAVRMITQYDRSFMDCIQYLLVDRSGAAAVVEGTDVVWMDGETFALTNFHLSDPADGHWPCWRYDIATEMLTANSEPTFERIAAILNAAHVPSTRYSVVCDLTSNLANVYYAGAFRRPIPIDLETLWAEGSDRVPLSSLR
jgi:hypothetical protein